MPTARLCHGEVDWTCCGLRAARTRSVLPRVDMRPLMRALADDPDVHCRVDQHAGELRLSALEGLDWNGGQALPGAAGRGQVRVVQTALGEVVVRHYRRGGWMARVRGDRYRFSTPETTRCFAEFRLLRTLHLQGLPVCVPVAARYQRCGWGSYRADLATLRIPSARSLHQCLQQNPLDRYADAVGATIGRCHAAGLWHADLNAHNLLCDAQDRWWLIDLDRSEWRAPDAIWPMQNVQRLHRSLVKLGHDPGTSAATQVAWERLLAAHAHALQAGAPPCP